MRAMASNGTSQSVDAVADYEYITPIGYSNSSRCGYCGAQGNSQSIKRFSYYANASSLSPNFYQTLLDRCWRRSGKLMYRPDQRRSCCPHYTIRLDSNDFKPNKNQRKVVNKFNDFVLGETYIKEAARLHPKTKEEAKKRNNEFVLSERVHEAEYAKVNKPPEPAHKFEVTLEDDGFTEEKYEVYNNYQKNVHGDAPEDRTRRGFTRFLCSSPLRKHTVTGIDGRERPLGSYHQCYRLDGKLVAIGVLDLLPDCVSSVYFLYDESIQAYYPGKLGALQEISLAYEMGYQWWYPGFYIHSCAKMRYKIDYAPQYILDPETLQWDLLDRSVLDLLDKKAFVSLHLERQKAKRSGTVEGPEAKLVQLNGAEIQDAAPKQPIEDDEEEEEEEDDDGDHSLFHAGMSGITTLEKMHEVDLSHIALKGMRTGPLYETSDLVGWNTSSISQWPSLKAGVAELVAALGTDCVNVLCLDLTRGGD